MDWFDPSLFTRPGLGLEEVLEIREAYKVFDPDRTDRIKVEDLVLSMRALGFDRKNPSIFRMIS